MVISAAAFDPGLLDLMSEVLEKAAATAGSQSSKPGDASGVAAGFEGEGKEAWTVMGRAVWNALAAGERDMERLRRKAIDELNVHRAKERVTVVSSSIDMQPSRPLLIRLRFEGAEVEEPRRSRVKVPAFKRKPFSVC
jgi:hypothetical protein